MMCQCSCRDRGHSIRLDSGLQSRVALPMILPVWTTRTLSESRMPFPDSPRVIFRNNPRVQVIAQLRFPTILSIGSVDPARFQELIRDEYPLYRKDGVTPD